MQGRVSFAAKHKGRASRKQRAEECSRNAESEGLLPWKLNCQKIERGKSERAGSAPAPGPIFDESTTEIMRRSW